METIIKSKKWSKLDIKEIFQFRELFFILAWRDVKVRYKQTLIGISWAVIQPFLMMVVFSTFFGRVAGINSGEIPYPIFTYVGLLFWNYFSNSLSAASASMVSNQAIIKKIYFPRIIIPISSTFVFLLDFLFSSLILVVLMAYFKFVPNLYGLLLIIPALLITFSLFTGLGLFFSAINIKYRDVRYALPFFIQLLIFVTPVIYPTSILGKYQWLWYINPMSGVIETMRAVFFQVAPINWELFIASGVVSLIILILGFMYFKKTERYFADLV